jgi:hypothetical protein
MNDHVYQAVADDDGPSQIGVGNADGRVVIQLAEPMQWFAMTPAQAVHVAMALMRNACEVDPSLSDGLPDNNLTQVH